MWNVLHIPQSRSSEIVAVYVDENTSFVINSANLTKKGVAFGHRPILRQDYGNGRVTAITKRIRTQ